MSMHEPEENRSTTITITEGTKKALDNLKVHQRQSYEEIIKKIIGELNPSEEGDVSNIQKDEENDK